MISSSKYKQVNRFFFVGFATIVLLFTSIASPSLGKPSNWSYKIGDNLRFDFKGCTKSTNGEDLICIGNFRSRNGEVSVGIGPGADNTKFIGITDSKGKVSFADEIRVGDNWSCRVGANCSGNTFALNMGSGDLVFVEGVDYKTLFIFKDISLPSSKIPLFFFRGYSTFSNQFEIKVRNINVTSSDVN
jgi:hypothetical protein